MRGKGFGFDSKEMMSKPWIFGERHAEMSYQANAEVRQ
jgi:hypothetical protein